LVLGKTPVAIDKAVVRAVLAKKGSNNVVYDWHLRIEAIYKFVFIYAFKRFLSN
jgi:hypothetical protein